MLMHTKAFGDYNGPEEVMLRTSNYTEINLIDNYGSSARIDFEIVDAAGNPVDMLGGGLQKSTTMQSSAP